jgi:hypothetical protein
LSLNRVAWSAIHVAIRHRALRCVLTYQSLMIPHISNLHAGAGPCSKRALHAPDALLPLSEEVSPQIRVIPDARDTGSTLRALCTLRAPGGASLVSHAPSDPVPTGLGR